MHAGSDNWEKERGTLLGRRISELSLRIEGTPVAPLVERLYAELGRAGLAFRPPVYLSDQWGCPEGTPIIGVPFYLADPALARIEADFFVEVESDDDSMRYLRHEAGHAFNYAYELYARADWHQTFGPYSRPYRERFSADPFSHDFVRHVLGWYAQKHPDEDFAETFAVWLTPGSDWRQMYAGWGALRKLEYVDSVMHEVGARVPDAPKPTDDDLPVSAMQYTVAEHYDATGSALPLRDERVFDGDMRSLFASATEAPDGEPAAHFLARHRREVVGRIAYWTGESAATVREFVDLLVARTRMLDLRVRGLEASTLIELTAFGTAVMMNLRHTSSLDGSSAASVE